MKTKKMILSMMLIGALVFSTQLEAQEQSTPQTVEITYFKPKQGHDAKFRAAVKAHNDAYHNEAPYTGSLNLIQTGRESGWYVVGIGPCTFSDLDNRPSSDAHNSDWEDNVISHVGRTGRTEYWTYNEGLSNPVIPIDEIAYETIWFIDIDNNNPESGSNISKFLKMAKEVNKQLGVDYREYYSRFGGADGRDIALVFPHKSLADLDKMNNFAKEFDKIHGEGSFEKNIKLWNSAIKSIDRQLWLINAY